LGSRRFGLSRVVSTGALGIAVVAVTQSLQLGSSIEFPLRTSIVLFAVSLPLSATDLLLRTPLSHGYTLPKWLERLSVRWLWALGGYASFMGVLFMFWHFSFTTCVVFGIASSLAYLLIAIFIVFNEPSVTASDMIIGVIAPPVGAARLPSIIYYA
jgi:hypothetical protein